MLRKIKNILGIEGVKIDMAIPEEIRHDQKSISGQIILSSQSDQKVTQLTVKLIEKYRRGRNDSKLINEYLLGSIELALDISIKADEEKTIDFELPFNKMLSEMDCYEKSNFFSKAFVMLAKKLKNVKSEYRVEAVTKVKGVRLDPLVTKTIIIG